MPRSKEKKVPISYQIPLIDLDHFSSLPEKTQRQFVENIKSGLIGDYLQAIEAVKKQKSLPTEEKLRGLLVPLILYNKLDPFDNPVPFIEESVDIERELDLENLKYDEERYQIEALEEHTPPAFRGIITLASYISIRETFNRDLENYREVEVKGADPIFSLGKISLDDLYEEWLPSLDQKKITSKDLLDQVLVAFTIKKAQNGDERAIKTLYGLYKDAANAVAAKFGRRFGIPEKIRDLKSDVQVFLWFVITGFRVTDIISQLVEPDSGKVIKNIPPWVKNFYINYLTEYVPQRMEKNIRETQRNQDSIEELTKRPKDDGRNQVEEAIKFLRTRNAFLDFQWIGMLNPYNPFQAKTRWRNPTRPNRFNNYSYSPGDLKMGPRDNLSIWLMGPKDKPHWGRLYQLLKAKYKGLIDEKRLSSTTDDAEDDFNEENTDNLTYNEKKKVPLSHFWNPPDASPKRRTRKWRPKPTKTSRSMKSLEEIVHELRKMGASPRDAEIFARCKVLKNITQEKMAMQCEPKLKSRRQVIRICKKVKALILSQ